MPIDIKAKAPNIELTPVIFLRWLAAMSQLLAVMAADPVFHIALPVKPLLALVTVSFAVNIHALVVYKRRQVPEHTVRRQLAFDIVQFCAFLYFTGGTQNPFSILLLAPLAMGASLLSIYSLILLIMLAFGGVAVLTFGAIPIPWPSPPPVLTPQYLHAAWVALMVALTFISFIIWRLAVEGRRVNDALKRTHAILEEKRRTSALGALAAAAVHELGSPLGTIAIITREIERDMHPDDPLAEDVALLKTETEKCKKILADIARNPTRNSQKDERIRLDRMMMEIASAQIPPDSQIVTDVISRMAENLPYLPLTPNLEYGLGNLISNAASYPSRHIGIEVEGWADSVDITITDDGPGFSPGVLKDLGRPYISTRETRQAHMGLGVFIAINLLEATRANLAFINSKNGGALVRIEWPRSALDALASSD